MDFLTDKAIYHGDLAARNILLTELLDAKISDFGLSKRLYRNLEIQSLRKQGSKPLLLPFQWVALEVLRRQEIFPTKSDVWSFGVVTWEIFSTGRHPYQGKTLEQKLQYNFL